MGGFAHNEAVEEPAERRPRGYRARAVTEIAIYAVSSIIVLYTLAFGWTLVSASNGTLSDTQAVAGVIVLGLTAPVCSWSLRVAVSLQAKQTTRAGEQGALSGVGALVSKRLRAWAAGQNRRIARAKRSPMSRSRVSDVGLVVVSVALFWAFYTGSLLAAAVVPATVHWVRWSRRRSV